MLVKCIINRIDQIKDNSAREIVSESVHLSELNVNVGERYLVYGVFFRRGIPWYLICSDERCEYPTPYCSVFFILVDPTVSQWWEFVVMSYNLKSAAFLPTEWARDGYFLEHLIDEDPQAVATFEKIKQREKSRAENFKTD